MPDLRPWIKFEGGMLYVFDSDGDKILYAKRVPAYSLKLFCQAVLRELDEDTTTPSNATTEPDTLGEAYDILREAALLMRAKNADYGDSWRLMRLSSITDQILVKINRVRTIEGSGEAPKVSEGVESEYRDILNYCIFAIIKLREQ